MYRYAVSNMDEVSIEQTKDYIYACVACFVIAFSRHFGIKLLDRLNFFDSQCGVSEGPFIQYALMEHLLISVSISIVLCVVMMTCSGYIAFKLTTNTFPGRQVSKSKAERCSIFIVFLVLLLFLVSEIPRIMLYIFIWNDTIDILQTSFEKDLVTFLADEKFRMAIYIQLAARTSFDNALIFAECRNIFTLLGCMSNFMIYVSASKKIQEELLNTFHFVTRFVYKTNIKHPRPTVETRRQIPPLRSEHS